MNRKDRRLLKKANKFGGTDTNLEVLPGEWRADSFQYQRPADPPPEPKIPGVTVPPEDPEFAAKVERNSWHDRSELPELVNVIQELSKEYDFNQPMFEPLDAPKDDSAPRWSWAKNWNCKYVNIRIDMRDGGFVFTNDKNQRINLEQLKWQWKPAKEKV